MLGLRQFTNGETGARRGGGLGPVIGAVAFALIEELVRPFGQLNVLVYGVLLDGASAGKMRRQA